jgi:DNA-binding MarR family transcriptional regulator
MTTEFERLLNVQNCVGMRMRRATRAITDFYNAIMEPSGLHANQLSLLIPPYLKPGMTINALVDFVALDRTTLARNLKLLEDRQLITLRRGADQRTRVIHVTELGRQTVLEALPLWEKAQQQVLTSLGEKQLDHLLESLDKVEDLIEGDSTSNTSDSSD